MLRRHCRSIHKDQQARPKRAHEKSHQDEHRHGLKPRGKVVQQRGPAGRLSRGGGGLRPRGVRLAWPCRVAHHHRPCLGGVRGGVRVALQRSKQRHPEDGEVGSSVARTHACAAVRMRARRLRARLGLRACMAACSGGAARRVPWPGRGYYVCSRPRSAARGRAAACASTPSRQALWGAVERAPARRWPGTRPPGRRGCVALLLRRLATRPPSGPAHLHLQAALAGPENEWTKLNLWM